MINKISKLDLYRYIGSDSNKILMQLRYLLFTPGFQYSWLWRKASTAGNPFSRILYRVLLRMCMFKTGIQIPVGTAIGEGLRISHFGTIVVNPNAVIGRNFSIAQGALVGNSGGKKPGVPVIGDNVILGANSLILGGVRIGNNVLVAPGAFINFDVPDDSIVIGNPGKIIASHRPTDRYNVYIV